VEVGEPVKLVSQKIEGEEGKEERREGADEDEERGKGVVYEATTLPGADNADDVAEDEANDEGCAAEEEGPNEAIADNSGDGGGECRKRGTEVATEDVTKVGKVLVNEGFLTETEGGAHLVELLGAKLAAGASEDGGGGVTRNEARQEEIDGERGPGSNYVKA
jgi:hypothetical protein